ncbi:MAG TPA: lipopolysaccharide assembly protein LapA domain-containing protein [Bacillales bacterium]|nr:lipopolysaccharide assembly protein LapA domain-containing protein [Bacillales bacterium]
MKGQWGLLFALLFALIVAVFAVINVDDVTVDYLFGTARWPLVIVILASALSGALVVGGFGIYRVIRLQMENRRLRRQYEQLLNERETRVEPSLTTDTGESHSSDDSTNS